MARSLLLLPVIPIRQGGPMDLYRILRTMDVLIVDDDPWMRDALANFFGVEGVRCVTAGNIREATGEIRKRKFGVIFCSFWLEKMDGLSFLKNSIVSQPDAVRILIAPFVPGGALEELKEEPSIRLLRKPIRIEAMETMLGEELYRRKPAVMRLVPTKDETKTGETGIGPGLRKPLRREDTLHVISRIMVPSRRSRVTQGGPSHGKVAAKTGDAEAHRLRLSRKGGSEG